MNDDAQELRRLALTTLMPGLPGSHVPGWVSSFFDSGLASICLYGENVESPEQLRSFVATIRSMNPQAIVAIDEEGGDVTRVHYREGSPYPGNAVLGRLDDRQLTRDIGTHVGRLLHGLGINMDLAPDVDVNSNPNNPVVGARSFGDDAHKVSEHATAWVEGLQAEGVAACAKHFPGHGDTAIDSHLAVPTLDASADVFRQRELFPFGVLAITEIASIMSSHICIESVDPGVPATYSSTLLQGILRDELGFRGVIVSDALDMEGARVPGGIPAGAVRALQAGCDLLCLGPGTTAQPLEECVSAIESAVRDGELPYESLRTAAVRVTSMAERFEVFSGTVAEPTSALPTPATVAEAFCGVEAARTWLAQHPDYRVCRIDSPASMAIGKVPWGPFAPIVPDNRLLPIKRRFEQATVFTPEDIPDEPPSKGPLVIVGRLLHLDAPVRRACQRWAARGVPILFVEMGWPADESPVPDTLTTFGASRVVGEALLEVFASS